LAATFLKNFTDTKRSYPGFTRDGVLLATYDLRTRNRSVTGAASTEFAARLLDGVRTVPGVESAAIATAVPLDIHGAQSRRVTIEGHTRSDGQPETVLTNTVTQGYFRTMEIPFVEGTDFAGLRDATQPPQAIVNSTFVRLYVPQGGPLGRRITAGNRTFTIVGVVKDSLYNAFGEDPSPFVYVSFRDAPSSQAELHFRTRAGQETAPLPSVRAAVRDIDPTLPLFNVRTLTAFVDANLVFQKIPARMFIVLGPMLLALVAIGIYAVAAYAVSLRRKEIGTRLALGATTNGVIRMLIGSTLRLVAYGMVAGASVATLVGQGTPGLGQLALIGGVLTAFLAAATVATWISARQVSSIDLNTVLKQD